MNVSWWFCIICFLKNSILFIILFLKDNFKIGIQKILLLNKGKLDPSEVEFTTSDGKSFDDIIEVNRSGLNFRFDDLEQFLNFFFPQTFSQEYDTRWETSVYDSMYYGRWDWYDELYDMTNEDWSEGYVVESIPKDLVPRLIKLLKID